MFCNESTKHCKIILVLSLFQYIAITDNSHSRTASCLTCDFCHIYFGGICNLLLFDQWWLSLRGEIIGVLCDNTLAWLGNYCCRSFLRMWVNAVIVCFKGEGGEWKGERVSILFCLQISLALFRLLLHPLSLLAYFLFPQTEQLRLLRSAVENPCTFFCSLGHVVLFLASINQLFLCSHSGSLVAVLLSPLFFYLWSVAGVVGFVLWSCVWGFEVSSF